MESVFAEGRWSGTSERPGCNVVQKDSLDQPRVEPGSSPGLTQKSAKSQVLLSSHLSVTGWRPPRNVTLNEPAFFS